MNIKKLNESLEKMKSVLNEDSHVEKKMKLSEGSDFVVKAQRFKKTLDGVWNRMDNLYSKMKDDDPIVTSQKASLSKAQDHINDAIKVLALFK